MKNFILTIVLFVSTSLFAQLEVKTTTSKTIYENLSSQSIKIKVQDTDTMYMFIFKNQKYEQIIDMKIQYFNLDEILQFFDLCQHVSETKEEIDTEKYSIRHYLGGNVMVFIDRGYTIINKRNFEKMKTSITGI